MATREWDLTMQVTVNLDDSVASALRALGALDPMLVFSVVRDQTIRRGEIFMQMSRVDGGLPVVFKDTRSQFALTTTLQIPSR